MRLLIRIMHSIEKTYRAKKSQRGFTLIELLIVIAILGVLAAVVLVAINPIEQLKRGRDASRISGVSQLGDAMIHWATAQNTAIYPVAASGWQTNILVKANETNTVIVAPAGAPVCGAGSGVNLDNGYCYSDLNSQTNFVIWTNLESGVEASKASCVSPAQVAAVYFGTNGKVQLDCLASNSTIPKTSDTLFNP